MRKLHLTNSEGRNATVGYTTPPREAAPALGLPGEAVHFRRYLAATSDGLHAALVEAHGADYAQTLVDGDPEIALEETGRSVGSTAKVYLSATGEVLYAPPKIVELIMNPDGSEKERREPVDSPANINSELPLRWMKMRLKRSEAVRRFAFRRTIQLRHVDGLSYDYLHGMAQELHDADEMVYIGGGAKGRDALLFQDNGAPYRGFLEGRVDGSRYQLLLHLSALELKVPEGAR